MGFCGLASTTWPSFSIVQTIPDPSNTVSRASVRLSVLSVCPLYVLSRSSDESYTNLTSNFPEISSIPSLMVFLACPSASTKNVSMASMRTSIFLEYIMSFSVVSEYKTETVVKSTISMCKKQNIVIFGRNKEQFQRHRL